MANSGVPRIDNMLNGTNTEPLTKENSANEKAAVGIMQDLLSCHGAKGIPNVRSGSYGIFGTTTEKRLKEFRLKYNLQKKNERVQLDVVTLRKLITEPPISARANQAFLSLSLDFNFSGLLRIISFVTIAEGGGKFDAFNENTDKQGLSFGIIQWAQKPGRLKEILQAFQGPPNTLHRRVFEATFTSQGNGMVDHTKLANGGVNPATGVSTDLVNFNLIDATWKKRFKASAQVKPFLQVQTAVAKTAFLKSVVELRKYAAPRSPDPHIPEPDPLRRIHSERGFAFILDLANQHGDTGAKNIYQGLVNSGRITANTSEDDALLAIEEKSVAIVRRKYPPPVGKSESNEEKSTKDRREFFRTTNLLSKDVNFDEREQTPAPPPLPIL